MATKPRNQARLTASRAGSLTPGDYTDPGVMGLQLRVRGKGPADAKGNFHDFSRTWLLRYKWRGESTRMVVGHLPGMTLEQARRRVDEFRQNIDAGIDPRRSRPRRQTIDRSTAPATGARDPHSIEQLAAEFMARYVRPNRKRPEYVQRILNNTALAEWKGRDARTIKPREVIDLLDQLVDRGSPVAANRTASVLAQLFKFGIHRRIVDTTPVQLLFRPGGKEKPRTRTLTDQELKALFAIPVLPRWERMHRAIALLLLTGQRRSELALASWGEIDFPGRLWTIPGDRTKTGKQTAVPLSDWAIEELQALKREAERSRWLFPDSDTDADKAADPKLLTRNLARALPRFKKDHGIDAFTLHDLRRTCRTGLARLKIQPHIAERVLNHVQQGIAGTYDLHDYIDEKRDALDKWAAHMAQLAGR